MKRTLIATALVTTLSTTAFAATDAQVEAVDTFAAGIDTNAMTDAQLDVAYGIVTSGDSRGEKIAQLRALEADTTKYSQANISAAEMMRIEKYAPEVDLTTVEKDQVLSALAITYGSASEGEKRERVQAVLKDYNVVNTLATDISEGQERMIENYVPDVDFSKLTEEDLQLILTYIHSGMSRGETRGKIEAIINS